MLTAPTVVSHMKIRFIYLAVFMYHLISVLNVIKLQILNSESIVVKELSAELFYGRRGDRQIHRQTNMTYRQTNMTDRQTNGHTGK